MSRHRPAAAALLASLLATAATAQDRPPADRPTTDDPVRRGAAIAALGTGGGASACAACHAFNGAADPSGAFPRLAGQSAPYLARALDAYADGKRRNVLMATISKTLTPAQRADVAAYYASVYAPVPPAAPVEPAVMERGRVLATVGSNDQQLVACATCHGPYGRSPVATVPSLGGQFSRYVASQLRAFASGEREAGAASMSGFAHALTPDQVTAVAAYFQRQSGPTGALPTGPR